MEFLSKSNIHNKNVIMRVDLNVPIINNSLNDYSRINIIKPSFDFLLERNCKILLISHFKDPKEVDDKYSLKHVVEYLEKTIFHKIKFIETFDKIKDENIILFENLRFFKGEKANSIEFAKQIISMMDDPIYVNEAFSVSHRNHASITQIPKLINGFLGLHFEKEKQALDSLMNQKPCLFIIGGGKLKTKLPSIIEISKRVEKVFMAGMNANTLLKAKGIKIGASKYCEESFNKLMNNEFDNGIISNICLPIDFVVKNLDTNEIYNRDINDVLENESIYDIGIKTQQFLTKIIGDFNSIVWNGVLGMVEEQEFRNGTLSVVDAIKQNKNYLVVGGGDTIGLMPKEIYSYASTAGGAFLEYLAYGKLSLIDDL